MIEWKVEELKLINGADLETNTTREEKIEFVDRFVDGKLSYILELEQKFKEDLPNLKKDTYGNIKTTSLKAWINKNDTKYGTTDHSRVIDSWYHYGEVYLYKVKRCISSLNNKRHYDYCADFVDCVFHECLNKLKEEEKAYFEKHDEYSILAHECFNKCMNPKGANFGLRLGYSTGEGLVLFNDNNESRKLTLEEIKELHNCYKKMDALEQELSKTISIKY